MSEYKSFGNPGAQPSGSSREDTWDPRENLSLGDYFTKKYQPEYNITCVKDWPNCPEDQED